MNTATDFSAALFFVYCSPFLWERYSDTPHDRKRRIVCFHTILPCYLLQRFKHQVCSQFERIREDCFFCEACVFAPASLHRRIVVAYRLRRLCSANSLLPAVSLRQKQHSVVFNLLHISRHADTAFSVCHQRVE